jgi:hypothetical protein
MMALKAVFETKEEIPESLSEYYEEKDGRYVLAVEGLTDKSKLDEFRNSNIELKKTLEGVTEKLDTFSGIDPLSAKDALNKMQAFENQELMEKGKFEELLAKKDTEYGGKIEALTKRNTEQETLASRYKEELESYRITSAIQSAVNQNGTPQSSAVADILSRARSSWQIDEKGNLFCVDENRKARYSENGSTYMTPEEWSKELIANAPHLFVPSNGSGANGSGELGGKSTSENPWLSGSYNLTKQGELLTENPTHASQLAREAGVTLDI